MAAQICEFCKHKYDDSSCYCSPNSVCDKYEEQIMANWIVKPGYLYECSNCRNAWNDELDGVSILDRCPECGALIDKTRIIWLSDIKEENTQDKMEDTMIRASRKAELTRNQLLDTLYEEGVLAVYNLGAKHMYEYLKGDKG